MLKLSIFKCQKQSKSLEEFCQDYWEFCYKVARKCTQDEEMLDDLVQNSWLNLIKQWERIQEVCPAAWPSYCDTVVRNTFCTMCRQNKRKGEVLFTDCGDNFEEHIVDESALGEADIVKQISAQELCTAIKALPERTQQLLIAKYLREETDAEIAEHLGINKNNVRTYVARARQAAYKVLKGEQDEKQDR